MTAFLIALMPVWAAYLTNIPVTITQPSGEKISVFTSGDEFHNWLHDADNYTIIQSPNTGFYVYAQQAGDLMTTTGFVVGTVSGSRTGLRPGINISEVEYKRLRSTRFQMPAHRDAPTTGAINNIVIYIRFSGETEFGQSNSVYDGWFNNNTNSQKNYFLEASYNQLTVNTTFYPAPSGGNVVSWQDSNPRSYYQPYNAVTNPNGYQNDTQMRTRLFTLLQNATNGVSSQIPSGLNIDADNDGNVDNVVYIARGATDGWSDLLWPHRWSIWDRNVYINSKRVYDYNFQLQDFLSSYNVGVICHEFFHTLGAPDLYHYTGNGIDPVGSWDIMESTTNPPQHMGAYMKWKYGDWISSIPTISADQVYTLNPLTSSTGNAYRINSPYSATEYFVVEFRKKTGTFENGVPGSGLLVYRINTSAGDGNASGPPDEVYIYRPGGTTSANGTVSSAHFSSETGRTAINASTNPNPFLSNGSAGGLILSGIGSSAGSTISFTKGSAPEVTIDFSTNPHLESFDDTTFPPNGWTRSIISGTYNLDRVTSGSSPTASPQSGAGMVQYNSYNASNGSSAMLVTPRIHASTVTNYVYNTKFYMYRDNGYLNNLDRIEVYYNTSANLDGTPVLLGTVNRSITQAPAVAATGWYQYSYDLSFPSVGYYYIVFKAISAYGNRMYLDSFQVSKTSTLLPPGPAINPSPADLATGVSRNPNFSWSAGTGSPTGYRLSFGTNNPPSNIVNNQNLGNVLSWTPPTLNYSSTYYWKIVPYNGQGNASDCPVWSFTTMADPTLPLPYNQDFEAAGTLPTGWAGTWAIVNSHGTSSSRGLTFNCWSSAPSAMVTSPQIGTLPANSILEFDYRWMNYSSYPSTAFTPGATDQVVISVSTNSGSSYTPYYTFGSSNHTSSTQFSKKTITLSGAKANAGDRVMVKIECTWGSGDWYFDIDNFSIKETPQVPEFVINPSSHSFGLLPVGTSSPQVFTITNNGGGTLQIAAASIGITGTNADDFLLTPVASDIALENGQSAELTVTFQPQSAGSRNATLELTDNTGGKVLQTVALSGAGSAVATIPYAHGFEDGWSTWNVVNGSQTNKWYVGSATAASGTNSAYISNNNGVDNQYNVDAASVVHFYHDITFPADMENAKLRFDWKGQGEGSYTPYDYLRLHLIETSTIPVAGSLPAGQIGDTYRLNANVWQTVTLDLDPALANSTKRLVFTWRNDGNSGTQPPAAVDNIRILTGENTDAGAVTDGTAEVTLPEITDPESNPIAVQVGIEDLSSGDGTVVTVTAGYDTSEVELINAGLTLLFGGANFGGATITIDHNLGFIPMQIAYRILPSINWILVDNPGDWTETTAIIQIASKSKADDDLEVVFPQNEDQTLPLTLSIFTAVVSAQNYVQLQWVTSTESGVMGYYLHRGQTDVLSEAILISPMIESTNTSHGHSYTYTDSEVSLGNTYYYWLQGVDYDGQSYYAGPIAVPIEGEEGDIGPQIPLLTQLLNAFPNPFNPSTAIRYTLKDAGNVRIEIFNLKGQKVREFERSHATAGLYSIAFDGKDHNGSSLASGVYYYKMSSTGFKATKKMLLMK